MSNKDYSKLIGSFSVSISVDDVLKADYDAQKSACSNTQDAKAVPEHDKSQIDRITLKVTKLTDAIEKNHHALYTAVTNNDSIIQISSCIHNYLSITKQIQVTKRGQRVDPELLERTKSSIKKTQRLIEHLDVTLRSDYHK